MGIYIEGMEMPSIDLEWRIIHGQDGKWYAIDPNAETTDGEWHEIVPVPEHGRLIDADALKIDIVKKLGISDRRYLLPAENAIWSEINKAPTVIPADKEGAE